MSGAELHLQLSTRTHGRAVVCLKRKKPIYIGWQGETTNAVVSPCVCGQRPTPTVSRSCS